MGKYRPEIIFHAAAYKHVPLLENQVRVAVRNNVLGTLNMVQAAINHKVGSFVLISTDKAVNPTNVMGATKRAAEIICQSHNNKTGTSFVTVRFGNVLGSAGSVVPLFKSQLESGSDLTVTHPEVSRYFMTIPEASQLILQATTIGKGGEIFVLDMGEPIKIRFLAEQMIKLSGKVLDRDINIIYTGLRPGEKLYEELFYSSEKLLLTQHSKILLAKHEYEKLDKLPRLITEIITACDKNESEELKKLLFALVAS
jgi:FlaA1/EpsC-like NDP-sugar epimerase